MRNSVLTRPRLVFRVISLALVASLFAVPLAIVTSYYIMYSRLGSIVDREVLEIPSLFKHDDALNDKGSISLHADAINAYLNTRALASPKEGHFDYLGFRDFHKTTFAEGRSVYPSVNDVPREQVLACSGSRIPFIYHGDQLYMCTSKIVSFDREFVSIVGLYKPSGSIIEDAWDDALLIYLIIMFMAIVIAVVQYRISIHITRRLSNINGKTLLLLGNTIALRDNDTYHHNLRVMIYCYHFGVSMGLNEDALRDLINGALLHDIGKIGIQDAILHKPGKLDKAEFETIKTHVVLGEEIIRDADWLGESVSVVKYHHERYDGKGYPRGLAGEDIPLNARIFAIVDVFDALTSDRPYKSAQSYETAMSYLIESKGSHFDAALLDPFIKLSRWLFDKFANRNDAIIDDEAARILNTYYC